MLFCHVRHRYYQKHIHKTLIVFPTSCLVSTLRITTKMIKNKYLKKKLGKNVIPEKWIIVIQVDFEEHFRSGKYAYRMGEICIKMYLTCIDSQQTQLLSPPTNEVWRVNRNHLVRLSIFLSVRPILFYRST